MRTEMFKLGVLLKVALDPEEMLDYEVRYSRMRLLLTAIAYMKSCNIPLISIKTLTVFDPLFDMMSDMDKNSDKNERLSEEFDFSWQDYVAWVKKVILSDELIAKKHGSFDELVRGMNTYFVPAFFYEHYIDLSRMGAIYFQNGDLYYCCYRDDVDEDEMEEEPPADTFRVLNLGRGKVDFHEGDVLYTGVLGIDYIARNNTIAITMKRTDWIAIYSVDRNEVVSIYRGRFLLGTTKYGEEVLLRDNVEKKTLEVVYADRHDREKYIMDYDCYSDLIDGKFESNWLYHAEAFMRAYTVDRDGNKEYCSDYDWKKEVWIAMLDGIETTCTDFFMFGTRLVDRILRVNKNQEPPLVFSLDVLELRMRDIAMETLGKELECKLFSFLREKGIAGDEDLFDFFAEAASYYVNMNLDQWMYSEKFISYLKDTEDLVKRIRECPESIFAWSRAEFPGEIGGRKCNSLKEFFGKE